jgi:hypothetical protein
MEECVRMMQQSLRTAPSTKKRAKSVYTQRNLGTIKERKKEKQQETEVTSEQTIMRILRMRYVMPLLYYGDLMLICLRFSPRTSEFIAQQLQIMSAMQAEQEQRMRESDERKQKRQQQYQQQQQIPAVPPLPELK